MSEIGEAKMSWYHWNQSKSLSKVYSTTERPVVPVGALKLNNKISPFDILKSIFCPVNIIGASLLTVIVIVAPETQSGDRSLFLIVYVQFPSHVFKIKKVLLVDEKITLPLASG
jgi:hypothetical protein